MCAKTESFLCKLARVHLDCSASAPSTLHAQKWCSSASNSETLGLPIDGRRMGPKGEGWARLCGIS